MQCQMGLSLLALLQAEIPFRFAFFEKSATGPVASRHDHVKNTSNSYSGLEFQKTETSAGLYKETTTEPYAWASVDDLELRLI